MGPWCLSPGPGKGSTDGEFARLAAWARENTLERFGPVRRLRPELVFEIGFEGVDASPRHKAGLVLRQPRMLRWRPDGTVSRDRHPGRAARADARRARALEPPAPAGPGPGPRAAGIDRPRTGRHRGRAGCGGAARGAWHGQSDGHGGGSGQRGRGFPVFLGLGLTSFGGPVAHLGYFREAFVARHKWLSDRAYADLVALCQFLPGPASSQVGMAIGLMRAGYHGMLAAWLAFTLPSAILLVLFAYAAGTLESVAGTGWIQGLKAAAVAVVAHAVLGMAKSLTPDRERATIAVAAMIGALLMPTALGQVAMIALGAVIGLAWLRPEVDLAAKDETLGHAVGRRTAVIALIAFAALLVLLPLLASEGGVLRLIDGFYRAGALVFGGGHVVLPLLQAEFVGDGLVDREAFLAGYGAAQAVPGPLFTFAAYLGAVMQPPPTGIVGATLALLAIFLPALLIIGGLPFWDLLRPAPLARRAISGVNAAVVGILGAALWSPVFTGAVRGPTGFALALLCFVLLVAWKAPPWAVVAIAAAAGAGLALAG